MTTDITDIISNTNIDLFIKLSLEYRSFKNITLIMTKNIYDLTGNSDFINKNSKYRNSLQKIGHDTINSIKEYFRYRSEDEFKVIFELYNNIFEFSYVASRSMFNKFTGSTYLPYYDAGINYATSLLAFTPVAQCIANEIVLIGWLFGLGKYYNKNTYQDRTQRLRDLAIENIFFHGIYHSLKEEKVTPATQETMIEDDYHMLTNGHNVIKSILT